MITSEAMCAALLFPLIQAHCAKHPDVQGGKHGEVAGAGGASEMDQNTVLPPSPAVENQSTSFNLPEPQFP